mmetsp:Transcript_108312/g.288221  ORF Transcript_108312/g.288221 Transcript_108312/m.288221 type:complete len:260 (+) Transcript_108312:2-781(+)
MEDVPMQGCTRRCRFEGPPRSAVETVQGCANKEDDGRKDEEANRLCALDLLVVHDAPGPGQDEAALRQGIAYGLPQVDCGKHGIEVAHPPEHACQGARQGDHREVEVRQPACHQQSAPEVDDKDNRQDCQDAQGERGQECKGGQGAALVGADADGVAALLEAVHGDHEAPVQETHDNATHEADDGASSGRSSTGACAPGSAPKVLPWLPRLLREDTIGAGAVQPRGLTEVRRQIHLLRAESLLPLGAPVAAARSKAHAC